MALPILTFHDFGNPRSVLAFPPRVLRRGLARLTARGLGTMGLLDAVRSWAAGAAVPTDRFVITIDDGSASVYSTAFPIFEELGLTATVFVCPGRRAPRDPSRRLPSIGGRPMLSWSELAELVDAGFSIGGHTMSHPDLTTLPRREAEREIRECRSVLEDGLGVAVESFAYPFGRYDRTARALAAEGYECACSDRLGLAGPASDRYALERVEMFYFGNERLFGSIGTPIGTAYLRARDIPRRARRALTRRRRDRSADAPAAATAAAGSAPAPSADTDSG